MSAAAAVLAPARQQGLSQIEVEADVDLGVTSRLLDLLVAHDRFPHSMNLVRDKERMTVTMALAAGVSAEPRLLAKMQAIPGVRRADALAAQP